MMATQKTILRYPSLSVASAFEKEQALIHRVEQGELNEALLLWQPDAQTLVLPAGQKWPQTPELRLALSALGWQIQSRRTGGAPVPQLPGVINVSYLTVWPNNTPYHIQTAYKYFCTILQSFFHQLGITTTVGDTPGSYCDGDYNLNIAGKKVVGTAQRILHLGTGAGSAKQTVMLAQACLLIDADCQHIVAPVSLCNQLCGHPDRIEAEVHTPLSAHLDELPTTEQLFQLLTQAFIARPPLVVGKA
ncbi:lipoate--protein ligase [Salinivibrio sp. YCSC6]|uniref:lipoate--protein ligase family protein n=2 Tax=Salinivibrio sp. YCSC6 TaxID=2003370 RepID=UPI000BBCD3B2|nr:lipoate--protein ligase [Salinivibrio sp. YCSC6]PCE65147.1 lipoate--protein ligase [Salinivibrio sp. YCSC6]QCF37939.1 lipoate--protein ligase [Salinivibrio sp. YCSC6]